MADVALHSLYFVVSFRRVRAHAKHKTFMQAMRHRSNVRWMNNIRFNMNVSESLFFPSHSLSLFLQKHNHHHYHDQDDSIHYFVFFTFMAQSMESIVNQPKILEFLCIFFVTCDYYYEVLLKVRVLFTRKMKFRSATSQWAASSFHFVFYNINDFSVCIFAWKASSSPPSSPSTLQ